MPTLAELMEERRAKFDAFDYDLYDGNADLDVSALPRAIQSTPVISKVDALAALDLIGEEVVKKEPELIISNGRRAAKLRGEALGQVVGSFFCNSTFDVRPAAHWRSVGIRSRPANCQRDAV